MTIQIRKDAAIRFLDGGGELGALMRAYPWETTPLGPAAQWPQSLKTAVRIMLTSRQPIWIGWGPDLTYLYNDAYKSIIGGKHPWALGLPAKKVWAEIWDDIGPLLTTAMTGEQGTYVEAQLLIMERNGYPEETHYTFSYSPIPDDTGEAGGIICANTDDTQRVIGERQMALLQQLSMQTVQVRTAEEASDAAAAALLANARDMPFSILYLLGADGRTLVRAGDAASAPDSSIAPPIADMDSLSPWPYRKAFASNEMTILDDLAERFGSKLPTGPWSRQANSAALIPIVPPGATARRALLIVGLNPYRLLDESYRRFLSLVNGQIAAAISNAQAYAEERRRAEALAELDRVKTDFFSNVSHEFRTPLTLMLGPLEDLRTQLKDDEENRDLVAIAHRNGLRLLRLVNSLLDFARLEAGRAVAHFVPTDLSKATADIASSFRSAFAKAGVAYVVDCPAVAVPVNVDQDMWEKIVLNLISNAFKFTLQGTVKVTLRVDEMHASLTVADTGVGIPSEHLPRIFERFHRIAGQQGRTHEGTGIGLALVNELVGLHGGYATAASNPGQGTTFVVTIPLGHEHLPAEKVADRSPGNGISGYAEAYVQEALRWLPETMQDVQNASPGSRSRARIILADDNADMLDYVRRLLGQEWDVEAVPDGEAALAAARRERPDLVLTDVMMPRLDGFGLVAELRKDPALRTVPIILLSARAGAEAQVVGLEAGADDYLIKPFLAQELIARVRTHLTLGELRTAVEKQERASRTTAEREQAQLKILFDELNHRVKNNLATVQAIAAATVRNTESPEAFKTAFTARLQALARAHDLLTRETWSGVFFEDLVAQTLAPYSDLSQRIDAQGDEIRLSPAAALALNMVFHELATNAAKYGALSVPEGRVDIRWSLRDGHVDVEWSEHHGPAVLSPTRRGLGSRLLERSAIDLGGQAAMDFASMGLVCRLDFLLSRIAVQT